LALVGGPLMKELVGLAWIWSDLAGFSRIKVDSHDGFVWQKSLCGDQVCPPASLAVRFFKEQLISG
jgi:hypothetical protein